MGEKSDQPESQTTDTHETKTNENNQQQQESSTSRQLALPSTESGSIKLDMSSGGSTVKLDHLGPLVVNENGTLSRIANWDQMADIEKKNTMRILGKRNQLRLARLKEAGVDVNVNNTTT